MKKLKLKLIITEVVRSNTQKKLRKLASPIISKFRTSPQFGLFHSALVIGPWYLEWTDREFCEPKRIFSQAAILAFDVDSDLELTNVDSVIDKLSSIITRWNVLYKYNNLSKNCQHFCEEILDHLGIDHKMKFSGQLGDYLKKLKNNGCCDMIFTIDAKLKEKTGLKEDSKTFKTHKELDEFFNLIKKKLWWVYG